MPGEAKDQREGPTPPRRLHLRVPPALFVFACCLVVYLLNGRTVNLWKGGDTIPNRLIPFTLLGYGTLTLDPFADELLAMGQKPFYLLWSGDRLVSLYPPGAAFVALPVYVPVYAYKRWSGDDSPVSLIIASEPTEKAAAAIIAAAAVALTYLALRRTLPRGAALWIAFGLGLGSSMWATASQMLWQHGPVALALAAGYLLVTWPQRPAWALAGAGTSFALGVVTRPTAALLLAAGWLLALTLAGSIRAGIRDVAWFTAGALPPLLGGALYNLNYFGNLLGGYGTLDDTTSIARAPFGLAGLLLSPNRGLLVFTPIALLGIYGLVRCAWAPSGRGLGILAVAALLHGLAVGSYREWAGGWSFGPRYLVDVLPVLALGAAHAWGSLGRAWKGLLAAAFAWSLVVQFNGVYCYPASRWNERKSAATRLEKAVWSWRDFALWEDYQAWLRHDEVATPW